MGIPRFVPCNVGWPRGGPRNRGIGAPARATPVPSERPRGDGDPGRLPYASRACPNYASSQAESQTAASPSLTISIPCWLREYSDRSSASLLLPLPPSPQHLLFILSEIRHVMMDNSTLYFRIHRLRSNAWDHGSAPVKAACSQSVVRTREARPFLPEGLRVQLMLAGDRSPCRSYQPRPVRAEISFPAQSFASRSKYRLAPVLPIWT